MTDKQIPEVEPFGHELSKAFEQAFGELVEIDPDYEAEQANDNYEDNDREL